MNHTPRLLLAAAFAALGSTALADCPDVQGRVSIVGNEFPAIQSIGALATSCANAGLTVTTNLTSQHQTINVPGMTGNPAEYTSAIIANSSIVALMNDNVIRPLDDLVARFGQDIAPNRLIRINGQIMAVAFMANAQHLVYREDVLAQVGLPVPTTYDEVLAAAEAIRAAGIMPHPVSGAYRSGWNLAQEFVNMYLGMGGQFVEPGSARVSINNAQGVAALNMMRALSQYMNPDFLTYDSNAVTAEWQAGNVAMANFWGSRTGAMTDPALTATPEIAAATRVGGPLGAGAGNMPATTLWWDGWTVARNISDADAEATFRVLAHATSSALLNDTTMPQAVWMIPGYTPAPLSGGVLATIQSGAQPYPMLPFMGLLHTALGDNLSEFLQGSESAEQALADVEAAYTSAARERGFLN